MTRLLPHGVVPFPGARGHPCQQPQHTQDVQNLRFAPPLTPYLGLDADLHDGSQDGEDVADHQEDVPAVEELHAVRQAHALVVTAPEEPTELLRGEKKNPQKNPKRVPLPTLRRILLILQHPQL